MPCLAANFSARARSRAATAVTTTSGTSRAGRISAIGAIRAAPRMPMRTGLVGRGFGCVRALPVVAGLSGCESYLESVLRLPARHELGGIPLPGMEVAPVVTEVVPHALRQESGIGPQIAKCLFARAQVPEHAVAIDEDRLVEEDLQAEEHRGDRHRQDAQQIAAEPRRDRLIDVEGHRLVLGFLEGVPGPQPLHRGMSIAEERRIAEHELG